MTTVDWVSVILASSVISAFISGFIGFKLASTNFKNDYYKQIISNRLKSYEQIEILLKDLNLRGVVYDNKTCHIFISLGIDEFTKFTIFLSRMGDSRFWYSEEMNAIVQDLFHFISHKIGTPAYSEEPQHQNDKLKSLGIEYEELIRDFRRKIEKQLAIDFLKMHDVQEFISSKKNKIYQEILIEL